MYGVVGCELNGKFDSKIIAIAKYEEVHELTKIIKAWRANTTKGKFEEISIAGITCEQLCVGDECD